MYVLRLTMLNVFILLLLFALTVLFVYIYSNVFYLTRFFNHIDSTRFVAININPKIQEKLIGYKTILIFLFIQTSIQRNVKSRIRGKVCYSLVRPCVKNVVNCCCCQTLKGNPCGKTSTFA